MGAPAERGCWVRGDTVEDDAVGWIVAAVASADLRSEVAVVRDLRLNLAILGVVETRRFDRLIVLVTPDRRTRIGCPDQQSVRRCVSTRLTAMTDFCRDWIPSITV